MAQQTAISWMIEQIELINFKATYYEHEMIDKIFKQAKQMEKEQIIKAHGLKYYDLNEETVNGEQYYKETYGENKD